MTITVKEARELAGPNTTELAQEMANEAFIAIREAATLKKHSLALHHEFWTHGGYSRDPAWIMACNIIRHQGFEVDFFYEERQFVDMYTIIKW